MMDVLKTVEALEGADVKKMEKRDFTEIKPQNNMSISDARSFFDDLFQEMHDKEKDYYTSYEDRINRTPKEDSELGSWEGERGESKFIPNENNEAANAAKAKLAEYGMDML